MASGDHVLEVLLWCRDHAAWLKAFEPQPSAGGDVTTLGKIVIGTVEGGDRMTSARIWWLAMFESSGLRW